VAHTLGLSEFGVGGVIEAAEAMSVLESRPNRPLRLRPWVLLGSAAVVVIGALALTFALTNSGSPSKGSGSGAGAASHHGGAAGDPGAHPLALVASVPADGATNVASNTAITLTFNAPIAWSQTATRATAASRSRDGGGGGSIGTSTTKGSTGAAAPAVPVLSPAVAGTWVQTGRKTLTYQLQSPLIPGAKEAVSIPSGDHGLRSTTGGTLAAPVTLSFGVAPGDTLRLQQLLAGLNYLPVSFAATGPAPARADLAMDQPGSFAWRWQGLPSELTSQWTQGSDNEITKAAVESFENQNNLGVDGIAGPAVWTALINDTINAKASAIPYVYVLVNKALPQSLTLWKDGAAAYAGIPVNTGIPGADTTDGTYAVFEHVRYSEMKGTNPDGSTYDDPNVPYASYFNGGDALHGFIRSSYGSPQSNGCVEMSYANAALVWPLTPIGTLVTVVGPNYGSAPPSTTTTAPAPAPPPPPPTTTTAPAAPPAPATAPTSVTPTS
jgi:lipoprotein-anchoring transpeptidase ErfK/SrfK